MNEVVTVREHHCYKESLCECFSRWLEVTYELPDGSIHHNTQSVYIKLLKDRGVVLDWIAAPREPEGE